MKVVYVAHPLGSGPDREANRQKATRWVKWVAESGHAPIADWILLSGVWEETPETRVRGLAIDVALVARCDEVWLVGGRVSPGMSVEADAARRAGILVIDKTDLGPEPPRGDTLCPPNP
jgi:hypothetical protein